MNENYIILIDENGRPYIEHGIGDRMHKYIMKIGDGAKARYFYTQQEIEAYRKQKQDSKDLIAEKKQNLKASKKYAGTVEKQHKKEQKPFDKERRGIEKEREQLSKVTAQLFKSGYDPGTAGKERNRLFKSAETTRYLETRKHAHKLNVQDKDLKRRQNELKNRQERESKYAEKLIDQSKNNLMTTINNSKKKDREALRRVLKSLVSKPPKKVGEK